MLVLELCDLKRLESKSPSTLSRACSRRRPTLAAAGRTARNVFQQAAPVAKVNSRRVKEEAALRWRRAMSDGLGSPDAAHASLRPLHGSRVAASLPKLIAFDLDGCLWWPEMWELAGPPFKRLDREGHEVADRRGEVVRLMGASHDILHELATADHFRGCKLAYVSRCDYPPWADQCLKLFKVAPGITLADIAHHSEIYHGSKTKHFRAVHKQSGIPYREMLFFDNEMRNCRDVATLGVTCMYTPEGMTAKYWEAGLKKYAKAATAWVDDGANGDGHRTDGGSQSEDDWT